MQFYNVRLVKDDNGVLRLDDDCFMYRMSARKNRMKKRASEPEKVMEWVDASVSDRRKLSEILMKGQKKP